MGKKVKKKFKYNKQYNIVIIAIILLLFLIFLLIYVLALKYSPDDNNISTSHLDSNVSDISVNKGIRCNDDDKISKEASNINFDYKLIEMVIGKSYSLSSDSNGELKDDIGKGFELSLSGLTDNLYVVISNDYNDDLKTIKYEDTDNGTFKYQTTECLFVITYDIKIYSTKDECKDSLYREFEVKVPKYNVFSGLAMCVDVESKYCDLLTYEDYTNDEVTNELIPKYQEKQRKNPDKIINNYYEKEDEKNNKNERKNFIESHKKMFIIIIVLTMILVIVISVIVFRKSNGR